MANRHDAISFLEEALLERETRDFSSLASVYWGLDNRELAEHYCRITLHHNPNNYDALSIMAKITNSAEWYEKALNVESNHISLNNIYLDHVLYPIEFI